MYHNYKLSLLFWCKGGTEGGNDVVIVVVIVVDCVDSVSCVDY